MLFLVSCNVWSCLSPNHIDDQILILSLKVAFDLKKNIRSAYSPKIPEDAERF